MTNIPQWTYVASIRNIEFDCLRLVKEDYVYSGTEGICELNNIEYEMKFEKDMYGFRNSKGKITSKADIVLIGDSHTLGIGVHDNEIFSSVLENKYGYKTKNLGVGSFAIKRELMALKKFTNQESVIVIQYCDNDFLDNIQSLKLPFEEYKNQVRDNWMRVKSNYLDSKKLGWVVPIRYLTQQYNHPLHTSKSDFYQSVNKRDIREEAKVFAKIVSEHISLLKDKRVIIFESSGWGLNHPRFSSQFREALNKYAPSLDFTVLDSAKFLNTSEYYFLDDHLNKFGHYKIAKEINKILIKNN
jgi:hypothetical protein